MSDIEVKAIQRRRGTSAEFRTFKSGLQGEVTVNTTNNSVVVSDGNGHNFEAARADLSNVNQINMLQKGMMDNSMSNFLVDYIYNSEDGTFEIRTKDSSTVVSQLSNAFIADKELKNVAQKSITDKGIARDDLKNVSFASVSWDSDTRDRLGGMSSVDPSGGGLVYRNFTNVDVVNFNVIPDISGVGAGGVAYKNLSNITGVTRETLKNNGICDSMLLNVEYNDLYGKDEVKIFGTDGSGKFVLRRDMSNVVTISDAVLNIAGIMRDDMYNAKYVESFDREDETDTPDSEGFTGTKKKTNELQIAHKDLGNVEPSVLTNTSDAGRFRLMTYDGKNADKPKVFKGSKNFLMNTTFTSKRYDFDENVTSAQFNNSIQQGFSKWIARSLAGNTTENTMYKSGEGVIFAGVFTQSMKDIGKQFANNLVYFSCDKSSDNFKVNLVVEDKIDEPLFTNKEFLVDEDYSIKYVEFDCTDQLIAEKLQNSKYVTLLITSDTNVKMIHPQLELHNATNWENRSSEADDALNKADSQHTIELISYDDVLPEATGKYVKLQSSYTSDDPNAEYYSNGVVENVGEENYLAPNNKVYYYKSGVLEYYCESSKFQFKVPEKTPIEIGKYRNYSLAYAKSENSIYTLVDNEWKILEDPKPYTNTLYYSRIEGKWQMYALNTSVMELEEISTSGSSSNATLPIFFHTKSDKRMNSAGWVCADNFSELSAEIYSGAFEYLKNQVYPVGKFIPSGREIPGEPSGTDGYDTSVWIAEWSDNSYDTTTVSMISGTIEEIKNWITTSGYTISKDSMNIKELEIKKTLEVKTRDGINYVETFDGLNVVVETTPEKSEETNNKLRNLYETTGWSWYYFMGKSALLNDKDFFKLPRAKGVEIGGDVHPSKLTNKAGDMYDHKLAESDTGSVGTYMSTYFYVGKPVIAKEEIQVGKTLEVVNEINSKLVSPIVHDTLYYVNEEKLNADVTLDNVPYTTVLFSNILEHESELEFDDGEGHVITGILDLTNVPEQQKTITLGYVYHVVISSEDGTESTKELIFKKLDDLAKLDYSLTEKTPVLWIATAKNAKINIDTTMMRNGTLQDLEFTVVIDKRTITIINGNEEEIKVYDGSVSISIDRQPEMIITDRDCTAGKFNKFRIQAIPTNYSFDSSINYSFIKRKIY